MTDSPLRGIRVLELGNYIAAPTAGRMLADFGADVDQGRKSTHRRRAAPLALLRRRHVDALPHHQPREAIPGRRPAQRRGTRHRARPHPTSDVLLENFRPGTLEKWGLDDAALEAANPDLVVARISAFGQTGPLSHRPGFAAVAEAYGGFRELVGEPGRPPSRTGVSIGDTIAGIYAAFGVVMSLLDRQHRAIGDDPAPLASLRERTIDVALNEAMLSVTESLVPEWEAYGIRRERTGGRMQGIAPSNAYLCADGKSIVVAGNGDAIYQRYMRA